MERVAGHAFAARPARLAGHRCGLVRGAVYPAVVPAPGAATAGVLWEGLDAAALARIDRFEGPLYERVLRRVELESGEATEAFVYVLREAHRALASDAAWDAAAFRARHLRAFLTALAREEP